MEISHPMPTTVAPDRDVILQELASRNFLKEHGHFVYTSGAHGSTYVNKDEILMDPWLAAAISFHIAEQLRSLPSPLVIAGPATGGIALAHQVANAAARLFPEREYTAVYAEKSADGFVFKRGFAQHIRHALVFIVEDVLNTGLSLQKMIAAVRENGGTICGAGVLCHRGTLTADDLTIPNLFSFLKLDLEQFPAEACPHCAKGMPVNTELGHGAKYLAQKNT